MHSLRSRRPNRMMLMLSQNVDGLDVRAGLPKAKSVAVHGSYGSAQCVQCRAVMPIAQFVEELVDKMATPPLCPKPKCRGFVKPSCVMYGCARLQRLIFRVTACNMFGEPLPKQFFELSPQDVAQADCVIIMGTSLAVTPFSERPCGICADFECALMLIAGELPGRVGRLVPRLLMNMSPVVKQAGLLIGQVCDCYAAGPLGVVHVSPTSSGRHISFRQLPRRGHAGQIGRYHTASLWHDRTQAVARKSCLSRYL